MRVAITVDFEPDCPPFLNDTFRGVVQGGPLLLSLFERLGVPATYFTTGEVAERFPDAVRALVAADHELACHGQTHRAFDAMDRATATWELGHSLEVLRTFAPVTSFRAPYLRFPPAYLNLLASAGIIVDSSQASYKRGARAMPTVSRLTRVQASTTSSVLRLPRAIRHAVLTRLADPVVLFVHPWEFVDLRHEPLRIDHRFRTGEVALRCFEDAIRFFLDRRATFVRVRDFAAT
jgi:peptidoglycan/xylan/chitin deacetylase (PgdA/CDA1 family)